MPNRPRHAALLHPLDGAFRVAAALLCSLTLLMLLGTASARADAPLRLNFGVYSSNKPSAMVRVLKPVLQELEVRMSARLGREVDIRMQIARDYDQGITDLTDGRVDFSHFGPASYVEAKKISPGIDILAMENTNDSKVFYGIIAVATDSDITSVDDLHGRSFAFGDEGSTIGRFLSQLYLEQHGIRAGNLSRYEYLGRHDKVGTAVGAGAFDAGALNEKTFRKLVAAGEKIRELARFPNVTKPWIARSGLDPQIAAALRASLLEITGPEVLAELKIDGFLSGSDSDYNDIRTAIDDNAVFFSDPEIRVAPLARPDLGAAVARVPGEHAAAPGRAPLAESEIVRSGSRITINIVLPPGLFTDEEHGVRAGPRDVTINLTLPEPPAAGDRPRPTSTTSTADEPSDADER